MGGTGRIGTVLAERLREDGHSVSVASRRTGVNTVTREGLKEAVDGVEVVIDLVESHSVEEGPARWFFETSTHHLLAAERAAQVRHHVALSIVGAQRIRGGYFSAKRAQEERIRSSGIPYTILRSTQVFEFLREVADAATNGGLVRLASIPIQPVSLGDLAGALAQIASSSPLNGTVIVAGPERIDLGYAAQRVLLATQDGREVIPDSHAHYLGVELECGDDSLLPEVRIAETRFDDWLLAVQSDIRTDQAFSRLELAARAAGT
jgi:uncharacterized protein YbjT (DUF2867 family)